MKHDVLIVADEIHGDLVCEGITMHHMAQVAPEARVITCTAVNKTFNLAGLAATNVFFSNAQDKVRFEKIRGFVEPNPFAISAVIAAYNEGDDWYEQVKAYIEANFDTVIAYFADHLRPAAANLVSMAPSYTVASTTKPKCYCRMEAILIPTVVSSSSACAFPRRVPCCSMLASALRACLRSNFFFRLACLS